MTKHIHSKTKQAQKERSGSGQGLYKQASKPRGCTCPRSAETAGFWNHQMYCTSIQGKLVQDVEARPRTFDVC